MCVSTNFTALQLHFRDSENFTKDPSLAHRRISSAKHISIALGEYRVRRTYRRAMHRFRFRRVEGCEFHFFTFHYYLLLNLSLLLIHRKRSPFSRRRRLLLRLKSFRASHSAFNSFRICGFAATSLRVKRATSFARMGKHHCLRHIILRYCANITAALPQMRVRVALLVGRMLC